MTRTALSDVISIGDPAMGHNFDLYFPTIPGSTDTRDLTFKCQGTSIPGFTTETASVDLHGVKVPYMGAAGFQQTMTVTFVESISWSIRTKLRAWRDSARNWITNKGSLSSQYCVDLQLVLWDDQPQVVKTVQIYRSFITALEDLQVDGANGSTVLVPSATFAYTYHQDL